MAIKLGWGTTKIILIVLFYTILTPIGLIYRIMGNDPLRLQFPQKEESFWINTNSAKNDSEELKQQF